MRSPDLQTGYARTRGMVVMNQVLTTCIWSVHKRIKRVWVDLSFDVQREHFLAHGSRVDLLAGGAHRSAGAELPKEPNIP